MIKLSNIYFELPSWLQNLSISLYAWYRDKFFRKNKYFPEAEKLVFKINSLKENELKKWQISQLSSIVNYAFENTDFYKNYYKAVNVDFKNLEDFEQLPLINKQVVRENWDQFKVDTKENIFKTKTSGTTGSSLNLLISAQNTAIERAGFFLSRSIGGYEKKDKLASFIGRKIMKDSTSVPPFWRYNFYERQLIFSNWHVSDQTLPFYIQKYNKFKPSFVNGYPSFLYLFSEFALRNKMVLHSPEAIFTGSETLFKYQRICIEKAFNSKIYDHYGSSECLVVAHQCKKGNYHLREELGYLEIINGEVYGTTFHNKVFPLIRYKIGDLMTISEERCNCGLSGRIIENIEGRNDDIIISKSGKKFGRISRIFQDTSNVKEAQVIQETIGELTIKIVPLNRNKFSLENISSNLNKKLNNDFDIKFQIVNKIPRTKSGKFRFVISKVAK